MEAHGYKFNLWGPVRFKGRRYDLSKIDKKTADQLYEQGCKALEKLPEPSPKKAGKKEE